MGIPFRFTDELPKKAIVWGTERMAQRLMDFRVDRYIDIVAFTCNTPPTNFKWKNYRCVSPRESFNILNCDKDVGVIIASISYADIKEQIVSNGIENKIFHATSLLHMLDINAGFKSYRSYLNDLHTECANILMSKDVIMDSCPKTGNSTVVSSLRCREAGAHGLNKYIVHGFDFMEWSDQTRNNIRQNIKKIIVGVRDPIAQNISVLWQLAEYIYFPDKKYLDAQTAWDDYIDGSIVSSEECRRDGDYGFEALFHTPMLMQTWFDDVFAEDWGIDIYEYNFDKEKGYSIYHIDNYDIFVYQLEKLSCLENELRDFLEDDEFNLINCNEASGKWYNDAYKFFIENFAMSRDYFEKSLNCKYVKHFYSDDAISSMKEKWSGRVNPC